MAYPRRGRPRTKPASKPDSSEASSEAVAVDEAAMLESATAPALPAED
jgi:hypothetical protein